MTDDLKRLLEIKRDLNSKWRVRFINSIYQPEQRRLLSACKRFSMHITDEEKVTITETETQKMSEAIIWTKWRYFDEEGNFICHIDDLEELDAQNLPINDSYTKQWVELADGYEVARFLQGWFDADEAYEYLWDKVLANIPTNENEEIEEDFFEFPAGTDRYEIWGWFDNKHSRGLAWLMNADGKRFSSR